MTSLRAWVDAEIRRQGWEVRPSVTTSFLCCSCPSMRGSYLQRSQVAGKVFRRMELLARRDGSVDGLQEAKRLRRKSACASRLLDAARVLVGDHASSEDKVVLVMVSQALLCCFTRVGRSLLGSRQCGGVHVWSTTSCVCSCLVRTTSSRWGHRSLCSAPPVKSCSR